MRSAAVLLLAASLAVVSAQNVPSCVPLCVQAKISEASGLAPGCAQNDYNCYCQAPNFVTAYNTCLSDNCANAAEVTQGQQLGATFCGNGGVIPGFYTAPGAGGASSTASDASSSAASASSSAASAASSSASAASDSASGVAASAAASASSVAASASASLASVTSSASNAASSALAGASSTLASVISGATAGPSASSGSSGAANSVRVQGAALLMGLVGGAAFLLA